MANAEEKIELATEALGDARVALMMAFRFLDTSLWRMPWEPLDCGRALATNGGTLYFNPSLVLAEYMKGENELVRDMLHSILHCILRHPFDSSHPDRLAWSVACDIAVESIAMQMCGTRFPCENDKARQKAIDSLADELGSLTPQKIYRSLKSEGAGDPGVSNAGIVKLQRLFIRDSHDAWAMWRSPEDEDASSAEGDPKPQKASFENRGADDAPEIGEQSSAPDDIQQKASRTDKTGETSETEAEADQDDQAGQNPGQSSDEDAERGEADDQEEQNDPGASPGGQDETSEEDEQAWEDISKQMQMDLETFSQNMGVEAGGFMVNLTIANQKQVDYADFLKRFTALVEERRINDDEFDYIFYTLGLERYGNMPLVEPLEYQEVERVRDFVIAIDTSGSCSGALVKAFLQQTHDILCESDRFGANMNVHVIQCDSRVQFDSTISSIEEFEEMERSFTLRGFGGTDFRPVFEYVDELVQQGEFTNLKGLIYFTDGIGTYPAKPPDYDVAFAFVGDEGARRSVPPWAMKVIIDEDSLMEM